MRQARHIAVLPAAGLGIAVAADSFLSSQHAGDFYDGTPIPRSALTTSGGIGIVKTMQS